MKGFLIAMTIALAYSAALCAARRIVHRVFESFESSSIQQILYQTGLKILEEIPEIAEIHREANNRPWDTIVTRGEELGVYTDPRPT